MRFETSPQLAEAMRSAKIARIEAVKVDIRDACSISDGCEDDCFACKRTAPEKPVDETLLVQPEHNNVCQHCFSHVLTTTGADPLTCWKCKDLPESSDPMAQEWWS